MNRDTADERLLEKRSRSRVARIGLALGLWSAGLGALESHAQLVPSCTIEVGIALLRPLPGGVRCSESQATCTDPGCNPVTGGLGYLPAAAAPLECPSG